MKLTPREQRIKVRDYLHSPASQPAFNLTATLSNRGEFIAAKEEMRDKRLQTLSGPATLSAKTLETIQMMAGKMKALLTSVRGKIEVNA
jgi:hypothetical protein